jgi:biopolymer transport protein ExbB/TolQ
LGFIGTVIGISEAIAGLHPLVGSAGDTSTVLSQSIGRVLAGLETAFDTTLLGLLCVIPTMMATMFLRLQGYQLNLEINECVGKMMLE